MKILFYDMSEDLHDNTLSYDKVTMPLHSSVCLLPFLTLHLVVNISEGANFLNQPPQGGFNERSESEQLGSRSPKNF